MKTSNPIIHRVGLVVTSTFGGWAIGLIAILITWSPMTASAEPTNGPLTALGLFNVPIGSATTLEIVDNGVLFVGNTEDGAGVSVQLGEADSGIFLYPLTGYLYEGDAMEGKAYGRVSGATNQFISSVRGRHNGNQSATVTVDFTRLGATRLSVFVGTTLLGRISNSIASIWVQGNGYGCRANPWWRLPDGSFGALIELAEAGSWASIPELKIDEPVVETPTTPRIIPRPITTPIPSATIPPTTEPPIVTSGYGGGTVSGTCLFIRPDDPTNSVEFVSRVDVTSFSLGSFCLTDARLGVFYQRHKALGQATLHAEGGQLTLGNFVTVTNIEDGVFVELPGVSTFNVDLLPLELTGTNGTLLISGFGTSSREPFSALGTTRIDNHIGFIQISAEMGGATQTEIQVRSSGTAVGSVTVSNDAAVVNLSGNPLITGCALLSKTLVNQPGIAVRVDRPTTFTASNGESFVGDEVRMLHAGSVFFDSIESFVMVASEIPSFTIIGESASVAPPPQLAIARRANGVVLSWPDPNRSYYVEAATALADGFVALTDEIVFKDNHCRLMVSSESNSYQFFQLRRHMPSANSAD
jgi:hypothetical protein